ncbi:MAG TPA: ABC transporter permease [bacterium]|nr:ABC transporter permease [bacterium]
MNRCLFFLARRFIGRRHKESFIYFTSFVSVIGIALGVASLMIVLGVMNGFSNDLKRKIIGAQPHIVVEGNPYLTDYKKIAEHLKMMPGITGTGYFAQTQIIYKSSQYLIGGYLRGIEGDSEIACVKKFIKQGNLEGIYSDGIILGSELAKELDINVNDTVVIIGGIPPREYSFKVAGIVEYGVYNVDVSTGIISLENFQKKFFSGRQMASIGLTVNDIYHCEKIAEKVRNIVPADAQVSTWIKKNKILFAALALEKKAMLLILAIIIIVASFNIASSLMMTVYRKIREIGVLKAIGMTKSQIRAVFLIQGFLLGIRGLVYGLVLGGIIIWVLKRYNIVHLPEYIYSISYLPVEISGIEIFSICAAVFITTLVASIFPAYRAGKLEPAAALRYE